MFIFNQMVLMIIIVQCAHFQFTLWLWKKSWNTHFVNESTKIEWYGEAIWTVICNQIRIKFTILTKDKCTVKIHIKINCLLLFRNVPFLLSSIYSFSFLSFFLFLSYEFFYRTFFHSSDHSKSLCSHACRYRL